LDGVVFAFLRGLICLGDFGEEPPGLSNAFSLDRFLGLDLLTAKIFPCPLTADSIKVLVSLVVVELSYIGNTSAVDIKSLKRKNIIGKKNHLDNKRTNVLTVSGEKENHKRGNFSA